MSSNQENKKSSQRGRSKLLCQVFAEDFVRPVNVRLVRGKDHAGAETFKLIVRPMCSRNVREVDMSDFIRTALEPSRRMVVIESKTRQEVIA